MEFTTEKRREMTASVIKQDEIVLNSEKFSDNINSAFGAKVDEDKTNREIFISLNSELTGYAYEYRYILGKYHSMLEEEKFEYIDAETNTFVKKTFWDCKKLQIAAALEEENEFHLNLNEGSTVFYPEHPEKYSHWVDDTHEEVTTISPTEQELFNTIRTTLDWYNNGGNSGHSQDLTIYNEFKIYDENISENKQQYMTVGFLEYTTGSPTYMSDGYDPVGDIIYINKPDEENFCLAKIISVKTQPSRILISPFFIKGEIPVNAIITSNHDQNNDKYIKIAHELINKLEEIYNTIARYLSNNPNKNIINNTETITNINDSLQLIKNFRDGDIYNVGRILGFVDDIEALRQPVWISRIQFIINFLTARTKLYEDRFKIIDMRLSKRAGTLREMMKIKTGISEIFRITDEKKGQVDWFKKYFIIKKCERDGDWKRRIFIIDNENNFSEGDEVYLLSDNPNTPEIKAVIDIVVLARLDDPNLVKYDEKTGEIIKEYYSVKKLFFKDAWKNGEVKLIRFFSDEYKTSEGFRVVKQITTIEIDSIINIITNGTAQVILT